MDSPPASSAASSVPALHSAAGGGDERQLCSLLAAGANLEGLDGEGKTALAAAAARGRQACLRALLAAGAAVEAADRHGHTPLHWAAACGQAACIPILLAGGACMEAADCNGLTAVHLAAGRGHVACLAELAAAGASLLGADKLGNLPIHVAACNGHVAAVRWLAAAGAQAGAPPLAAARNGRGKTPRQVAADFSQRAVERLLRQLERQRGRPGKDIAHGCMLLQRAGLHIRRQLRFRLAGHVLCVIALQSARVSLTSPAAARRRQRRLSQRRQQQSCLPRKSSSRSSGAGSSTQGRQQGKEGGSSGARRPGGARLQALFCSGNLQPALQRSLRRPGQRQGTPGLEAGWAVKARLTVRSTSSWHLSLFNCLQKVQQRAAWQTSQQLPACAQLNKACPATLPQTRARHSCRRCPRSSLSKRRCRLLVWMRACWRTFCAQSPKN